MEFKLVVVARSDLHLTKGKLAVQVAHASVTCALKARSSKPGFFKNWMDGGQKKVVVKTANKEELLQLRAKAEALGLITALIDDAGLTQLPPGTTTCLGVGPAPDDLVDQITGHLKLV